MEAPQPAAPVEEASPTASSSAAAPPPAKPKMRRTRESCLTCRTRKKGGCDRVKPSCGTCSRLSLTCEWEDPVAASQERRRKRAEKKAERERLEREAREQQARAMVQAYDPNQPGLFPFSGFHPTSQGPSTPWMPFLGSFAPAPVNPSAIPSSAPPSSAWPTAFSDLIQPYGSYPHAQPFPATSSSFTGSVPAPAADAVTGLELELADLTADLQPKSPPFDLSALLRTPTPPQPFSPILFPGSSVDLSAALASFATTTPATSSAPIDSLALTSSGTRPASTASTALAHPPAVTPQPLSSTVSQAASLFISSDFAFTKSYLLSHYTSSLAHVVSLASVSSPSTSPSASGKTSSPRTASATSSANLYLSLVPLANRHPPLMHSILSWSAANLAAASATRTGASAAGAPGASDGGSVMARLSDELGAMAEKDLEADEVPRLRAEREEQRNGSERAETATSGEKVDWEAMLAAEIMLSQASICRGDVAQWRVRLRAAASIVSLVGGVRACSRTPLGRQLVRNLLYHDALSSTAATDGALLEWEALGEARREKGKGKSSPGAASEDASPGSGSEGDEAVEEEEEEDEDELLDTLMGTAQNVFVLVSRITALAKEKRQAIKLVGGDSLPEDDLALFLPKVEEVRLELEKEKERADALVSERPDLDSHRHFHEVFRLAALLYLHMLLELPPRSLTMLLLTRKLINLTEIIVSEDLPGLCSMHWPLYIMHLNSTPLVSPHSPSAASDRARSTALFDKQMAEFSFMNTRRSRELSEEVWRRSADGKAFVDPDDVLAEWGWHLNYA
ncbi:hypothetical protein JCM8097_003743 [Rhodosporidiobolus ruineniae]